jgi:hypothetical protein
MSWSVTPSPIKGYWEVAADGGRVVAQVIPNVDNARLIATAPELLALCKMLRQRLADLVRHVDEDTDSDADLAHDRDAVDDADAAIAKAEGRSQ